MNIAPNSAETENPFSVLVANVGWELALASPEVETRRFTQAILDALCVNGVEISFLLADNAEIRQLNNTWRAQDKPTNVLSFPSFILEPGELPVAEFAGQPVALGDIALAYETVASEAAAARIPFSDHFGHLIIHGVLHLLGYDHQSEDEAELMEGLERQVLAELGIPDPYDAPSSLKFDEGLGS